MQNLFNEYIKQVISVKNESEHSGRTFLHNLLNQIKEHQGLNLEIIHESKRDTTGLGAPDFRVNNIQNHTVVGYIENKKIDENLNKVLKSKQISKYKELTDNLILTDYLEWIWIFKGEVTKRARLGCASDFEGNKFKLKPQNIEDVQSIIVSFLSQKPSTITKVSDLAQKLARPTIEVKKYLFEQINLQGKDESKRSKLFGLFEAFREALFEDLEAKDFADSFAQMLTYAVFLAKINNPNDNLNLQNVKNHIAQAFKLIKSLVDFLDLLNEDHHKDIKWAVENILSVINNIKVASIAEELHFKYTTGEKDPYIYFYEDFLKEYDKELRVDRGVYYTPTAVVEFIVREVSNILQEDFNLEGGVANKKVKLLDFASGTGTFLFEVFREVIGKTMPQSINRKDIIENHILKNIYGFELLISAYIISHLKLSQFLKEEGYDITTQQDKRLQVYLTNTLEYKEDITTNWFAKELGEEGNKAKQIKDDKEIIAIVGNPPYNVSSMNILKNPKNSKEQGLLDFHASYKPIDEKTLNSLSDDYIKFIAFAHKKIKDAGRGVIGTITNNSFLKGITHRKMRGELLKDFNQIYIIDLHGNARIGEKTPEGTADENAFDIMQGVSIMLLVKTNDDATEATVKHLDLFGKRADKFKTLASINRKQLNKLNIKNFNNILNKTRWKNRFVDDLSFFAADKNLDNMEEYAKGWGIPDIFAEYSSGIQTKRDNIAIQFTKQDVEQVVNDFNNLTENEIKTKYNIAKDSRDWHLSKAKQDVTNNINNANCYQAINYRPFDVRQTFYTGKTKGFSSYPVKKVMQHMLNGNNLGLVFPRISYNSIFDYGLITDSILDGKFGGKVSGSESYLAPLYLYQNQKEEETTTNNGNQTSLNLDTTQEHEKQHSTKTKGGLIKKPNFTKEFAKMLQQYGKQSQGQNNGNDAHPKANKTSQTPPTPEEVMGYIYAILHTPTYRTTYLEFLKIDFPRIPFTKDINKFKNIAKLGQELIDVHLLKTTPNINIGECYDDNNFTNTEVEKITYNEKNQTLYFNQTCHFKNITKEVWEFTIGGYQVLDKYLKSRKNKALTTQEIQHLTGVIKAISFTITQQQKINEAYEKLLI